MDRLSVVWLYGGILYSKENGGFIRYCWVKEVRIIEYML